MKVGKTEKSAQMALSHTGALVGNHVVYEALFRTYGVIEVNDMDEMAATLALFDLNKSLSSGNLVTIHDSGGERELVVDLCDELSIDFSEISVETKNKINTQLEPGLIAENPIDIFGTNNNYIERYSKIIEYLANDQSTAICLFMANPRDGYWYAEGYAKAIKIASQNTSKIIVLVSNFSLVNDEKMASCLFDQGVPLIRGTKNALLAVKHALNWRNYLSIPNGDLKRINKKPIINAWIKKLLKKKSFSEFDGLEMLRAFGVSVAGYKLLNNEIDLLNSIDELSYPLVLKTAENINHKSDVGGVKLNLTSEKDLINEYHELNNRFGPKALLMEMRKGSVEICVGAIIDDDFGPVIVLSAGGTLIEVIDDTISALAPIDPEAVKQLLLKLNISKMFNGVRGCKPINLEDLCNQISNISFMISDLGSNLKELDINPIICSEKGAWAVDCLAIGNNH